MRLQSSIAIFLILSLLKNVHSKSLIIEVPHDDEEALAFRLIHVNDIHAHFDPINEITGRCNAEQAENEKCYGGVARLKTAVDQIRNMEPKMESLFLNAGDYYQVHYLCKKKKSKYSSKNKTTTSFSNLHFI